MTTGADDANPVDEFDGWDEPNYTGIPDSFFDKYLAFLTCAETKVMLYIFRRTFGFKRRFDVLSLSQIEKGIVTRDGKRLDYGTGMAHSTVVSACKSLEQKGMIAVEKRRTEDGDSDINIYLLKFRNGPPAWVVRQEDYPSDEVVRLSNHRSSIIEPEVVRQSNTQYTGRKTESKKQEALPRSKSPKREKPSLRTEAGIIARNGPYAHLVKR